MDELLAPIQDAFEGQIVCFLSFSISAHMSTEQANSTLGLPRPAPGRTPLDDLTDYIRGMS